jgi:uncharacterized protein (DUF488 family)
MLVMMTIGHSTLAIEAFLRALQDNGVKTLVDVRRFPGSRRHPQFSQTALFRSLEEAGIRGAWREGLGGRREAVAGSVNTGWKNESFRGYADYMQTAVFEAELDWLVGLAEIDQTVVMCAEAVPWRCHRSLIADALMARGVTVEDIFVKASGENERRPHAMTSFAQMKDGRVSYPKEPVLFG